MKVITPPSSSSLRIKIRPHEYEPFAPKGAGVACALFPQRSAGWPTQQNENWNCHKKEIADNSI